MTARVSTWIAATIVALTTGIAVAGPDGAGAQVIGSCGHAPTGNIRFFNVNKNGARRASASRMTSRG